MLFVLGGVGGLILQHRMCQGHVVMVRYVQSGSFVHIDLSWDIRHTSGWVNVLIVGFVACFGILGSTEVLTFHYV